MPVAGKKITKQIDLKAYPADDPGFVVLWLNPTADVWEDLPEDSKQASNVVLSKMILEWNFTDEAGKILDITPDNVKKSLSVPDMDQINQALGITNSSLPDSKKNS